MSGKKNEKGGAIREIINTTLGVWLGNMLGKTGKGLRKKLFRWRRALAPLWFGGFIWLVCVLFRWQFPGWWWLILLVPVGGALLAWFGPKLSERWAAVATALIPNGIDKGKDGVLDRPVERIYFGTLTTYIGAYMAIRIADGPSELTGWIWQIGVVLWGGAWWYHRRVRVAGRADKFARKWDKLSDRDTCPGRLVTLIKSKVIDVRSRGRTSVLKIRLEEGHTIESVRHINDALASFFGLRPGSVFIAPDPDQARNVIMTFLPKDPWKGKIPHPVITDSIEPGRITLSEMGKRFAMGVYAHGERILYSLQHTLVVGASGSGKSGWLHSLMMWLTAFSDVVIVAIDMAAGATLGVWRKALALPLAEDLDGAIIILERVFGVIRDREIHLGLKSEDDDEAEDSFQPSRKTPWLILIIDEFPDLIAEAKMTKTEDGGNYEKRVVTLLSRIAKKARKCGVRIILASQNGTKVDLGSKEMQAQLRAIVGLNMDAGQNRNLWLNDIHKGWNTTGLTMGQFLLKDEDHSTPDPAKGFWVENKDRRAHVAKSAALHKRLEPSANDILMGLAEAGDYDEADIVEAASGPEVMVLDYLKTEAPEGAKVETISDVLTKAKETTGGTGPGTSRATIYRHLEKLESLGLVERNSGGVEGLWKAIEQDVPSPRIEGGELVVVSSIQGEQQRA